jgi:site-specific DNA-methyltransferase (adenine-specific)
MSEVKERAPRNRTLIINENDTKNLSKQLIQVTSPVLETEIINKTIQGDTFKVLDFLPNNFVDLVVVDPPYNLTKSFNGSVFKKSSLEAYEIWLDSWIKKVLHTLKQTASIYVCCDWQSSSAVHRVLDKYLIVRNRITWEREKGRGAKSNWKNCSEDIWFCTVSDNYYFDVESVKMKRKVIAPYRDKDRKPKDWEEKEEGNFRVTHPSNLWNDISIPFWSMPENTDHPTQKPEKLIAKLILASSKKGDLIFDPFLGSGTTSVVAKKLDRSYFGIEQEENYCYLTEKRLEIVENNKEIQGYSGGYFWERNTLAQQNKVISNMNYRNEVNQSSLFD